MDGNSLAHYGILGMKWGIRRTLEQLERASPKVSQKPVSELSDEDIQRRIDRIELERKYKELTRPEAQKKSRRGKDFCENLLKDIGRNVVQNLGGQVLDHYKTQS